MFPRITGVSRIFWFHAKSAEFKEMRLNVSTYHIYIITFIYILYHLISAQIHEIRWQPFISDAWYDVSTSTGWLFVQSAQSAWIKYSVFLFFCVPPPSHPHGQHEHSDVPFCAFREFCVRQNYPRDPRDTWRNFARMAAQRSLCSPWNPRNLCET